MENNKHVCNVEDLCGSISIIDGYETINGKHVKVSEMGHKVWCKGRGGWSNLITWQLSEITWDQSKDKNG